MMFSKRSIEGYNFMKEEPKLDLCKEYKVMMNKSLDF